MLAVYALAMLLSFYLLAKVCDKYFVAALDKIAHRFKLSSDAAGATLMAMGSSAPELFVSLLAILRPGNHGAMGTGTIVGSAIFNILVIIGASVLVKGAKVLWQPIVRDIGFYVLTIILLILTFIDGKIEIFESIWFIALYVIYILAVVKWKKWFRYEDSILEMTDEGMHSIEKKGRFSWITGPIDRVLAVTFPQAKHYYWLFAVSIIWITALSWVLVESAVGVAHILGVPEVIIGLTILAAGTSIPDTISSVIVAKQGRVDMAVSNAIGSNIFDILFGLGLPWLIAFFVYGGVILVDTQNLLSSVFLLFFTVFVIFFLLLVQRWHLGKKSGLFLIALYIMYLIWLIGSLYI